MSDLITRNGAYISNKALSNPNYISRERLALLIIHQPVGNL